jgi:hypothetical protein
MAKAKKQTAQGVKRMVHVRSKRYGDHERNPRGTFKPAVLNEVMEKSKNRLLQVNKAASLIFSCIRDEHNDGTLWTRLLSALRHQLKEKNYNDVHCLLKLECHAVHTLTNILRSNWHINTAEIVKRQLAITMSLDKAPRWKTRNMHHFQVSLHVIYPDLERNRIQKEIVHSEVFPLFNYPEEIPFVVPVPPRAPAYAVFLKVTGCTDGVPGNGLQSTGMRCVATGIIKGNQQSKSFHEVVIIEKPPAVSKSKRKTTNKDKR